LSKRILCLDACIFQAENKPDRIYREGVLESVQRLMSEIDTGSVFAIMPATIAIELLDDAIDLLLRRNDNRKCRIVEVDIKTARLARDIRNKFTRKTRDAIKQLELPDCIYVATAIHYECEALVTRDGEGNRRHNLLNVANEVRREYGIKILHPMEACPPPPPPDQPILPHTVDTHEEDRSG